jgi:hypothetical protein
MDTGAAVLGNDFLNRPATTNLDVVAMRTEQQHGLELRPKAKRRHVLSLANQNLDAGSIARPTFDREV